MFSDKIYYRARNEYWRLSFVYIWHVSLSRASGLLAAEHMRNVIGLTFDHKRRLYFFSDIQKGSIFSVLMNGSSISQVIDGMSKTSQTNQHSRSACYALFVFRSGVGTAESLAFEEVFSELYWTSYSDSSIYRANVRSLTSPGSKEKLVQLGTRDHPRALVVDSCSS